MYEGVTVEGLTMPDWGFPEATEQSTELTTNVQCIWEYLNGSAAVVSCKCLRTPFKGASGRGHRSM